MIVLHTYRKTVSRNIVCFFSAFLLCMFIALFFHTGTISAISLNALNQNEPSSPIIVSHGHTWPPFSYLDEQGNPKGLLIDLWNEIGENTGRDIQFRLVDWAESLEQVRAGSADLHGGLFYSEDRSRYMDFSDGIMSVNTFAFVRSNLTAFYLHDLADERVGVTKDSYEMEFMQAEYPEINLLQFSNNEQMVQSAIDGEINVFIADYPIGMYLLDKLATPTDFRPLEFLYSQPILVGVAAGNEEMLQFVNDALSNLSDDDIRRLSQRWMRIETVEAVPAWVIPIFISALAIAGLLFYSFYQFRSRRQLEAKVAERTKTLADRELHLRTILKNIPGFIYQLKRHPDGRYSFPYVSEGITIMNLTAEELQNNPNLFFDVMHPDDRAKIIDVTEKYAKTLSPWKGGFRVEQTGGNYIWIEAHDIPVKLEDGSVLWTGFAVDVTDKKEAEFELKKAKEEAEVANQAKNTFLANMSHEIRTPLTGVIGFTELLNETDLSQTQREFVENIHTSGRSLLDIINNILDFSKIETGKIDLEPVKTDIIKMAENAIDVVTYQASKKNLDLVFHIKKSVPQFAVCDVVRLRQVLVNLLGNAVKFTDEGRVEFRISFRKTGDNIGTFIFDIKDTGIGISDELKPRLFEAFTQADHSPSRKFGGTGLGLAISKMLADEMNGNIQVESIPGTGSVFSLHVELPFIEDEDTTQKYSSLAPALIIDPDPNHSHIVSEMLERFHIENISFNSLEKAASYLDESDHYPMVLIDSSLMKIPGFYPVQELQKLLGTSDKTHFLIMQNFSEKFGYHKPVLFSKRVYTLHKPVKPGDLQNCFDILDYKKRKKPISKPSTNANQSVSMKKKHKQPVILIADDAPLNLLLIRSIINKFYSHVDVLEAVNGREVLEVYKENHIDLILMDIQMPEKDGVETTREIRKLEADSDSHTPIVALTAMVLNEDKDRCIEAGMDNFLTKPVDREKLNEIFDTYLSGNDKQPVQ
jgi:PAS domain S-box-containing protein